MSTPMDWDQFLVKDSPAEDKWSQFAVESPTGQVKRHLLRSGARAGEMLLGLGGEIREAPGNLMRFGEKLITGKVTPESKFESFVKKVIFPPAISGLPTSSEVREKLTKPLSGEYLEPRTKGEELSDEVVQDLTALMIPIKGRIPFMRALGSEVAAQSLKQGIKLGGGSEETQELAKLGGFFLGNVLSQPKVKAYKDALYKKANSLRPEYASTDALNLESDLNTLKTHLKRGGTATSKTKALEKIDEVLGKIEGEEISVVELEEFKKTINEARSGLYQEAGLDKKGKRLAKRNLDDVSKSIDKTLAGYGKENPEWFKSYKEANAAHAAIEQSKKMSKFIWGVGKKFGIPVAMLELFGLHAAPGLALGAIKGVGLLGGGVKSAEFLTRVLAKPALRKHYLNVLKNAGHENVRITIKDLDRLEKAMREEGMFDQE